MVMQEADLETQPLKVNAKVRLVERWQPMLTMLLPIATFMTGIWFNAYQQHMTAAKDHMEQWRDALQKVSFDQANLITTAVLMESFEDDRDHQNNARNIERTVLSLTNSPEIFDFVYGNMVRSFTSVDDVNESVEIGRTLDEDLTTLYKQAVAQLPPQQAGTDFSTFLRQPEQFFPRATRQAELHRTMILLWELDTFSQGIACVAATAKGHCAQFPLAGMQLNDLFLVNYPLPQHAGDLSNARTYSTCAVHHDPSQSGYMCL